MLLSIGAAFYDLRNALLSLYDQDEASAVAHQLLQHITGLNKLERLSQKEALLTAEQATHYTESKGELLSGRPLQYVLGEAYFMGDRFLVSPAVLIPRQETEELVQWIIEEERPQNILDIGTGSGCIAISLKKRLPQAAVNAIDVSTEALEVARRNAAALGTVVTFINCDFLTQQETLGQYDLIVSNPPYIPVTEKATLHTNVRDHEPGTALFVPGDDALLFYEAIARFGQDHLTNGGAIYCELHQDYAEATGVLFKEQGYPDVTIRKDMHGNYRMLRAWK
jgi:release factor glutamine methyltransferase